MTACNDAGVDARRRPTRERLRQRARHRAPSARGPVAAGTGDCRSPGRSRGTASSAINRSPSGVNAMWRGLVSPSATGTRRTRNSSPGGHWPCGWPFGEHGPGTHVSNTSGSGAAGGASSRLRRRRCARRAALREMPVAARQPGIGATNVVHVSAPARPCCRARQRSTARHRRASWLATPKACGLGQNPRPFARESQRAGQRDDPRAQPLA